MTNRFHFWTPRVEIFKTRSHVDRFWRTFFSYIQKLNTCTFGLNVLVLRVWTYLYFGCQRTLYSAFCILFASTTTNPPYPNAYANAPHGSTEYIGQKIHSIAIRTYRLLRRGSTSTQKNGVQSTLIAEVQVRSNQTYRYSTFGCIKKTFVKTYRHEI